MIELMVSVTILGVMMYSLALVVSRGRAAYRSAEANANIESQLRRTIDRIAHELTGIGEDVIFPDPIGDYGTDTLSFQKAEGVTDGDVDWGPVSQLAFVYEKGEVDDGIDNNGNGLIDEGILQLTRDLGGADEVTTALCRNVSELMEGEVLNGADDNGNGTFDERGFSIQRVGDSLEIRLMLLAVDGDGRLISRVVSTTVGLRN
jgi:hypothetical protein